MPAMNLSQELISLESTTDNNESDITMVQRLGVGVSGSVNQVFFIIINSQPNHLIDAQQDYWRGVSKEID